MESGINRKIILAIVIVLLLFTLLGLYFLFFSSDGQNIDTNSPTDTSFPLGESKDVPTSINPDVFPTNTPGSNTNSSSTINTNNASSTLDNSPNLLLTSGKFKNLVPEPVASAAILSGTSTSILYLDQANGNLYKISLLGEEKERLSFTTIPNIRQVVWGGTTKEPLLIIGQDGLLGLTFSWFKLSENGTTTSQLVGSTTPISYYTFSSNPTKNKLISLKKDGINVSINTSDFSLSKPEKVSSLVFGDWRVNWFKDDLIALETRPSALFSGSLYFLNLKNKSLDKIIGGINGLITKVSPDGNYIVYSGMEGERLSTYLYNLKTHNKTLLTFATLADKCAWRNDSQIIYCAVPQNLSRGQYPDSWYKGLISTTDDFWQVEIASSTTKIIAETGRIGTFDVYKPFLDPEGETIIFTNKKDLSLWSFDVREGF